MKFVKITSLENLYAYSTIVSFLVMHRLSVKYWILALLAQKPNYRYRLKFSRYFRCIHNSIRSTYVTLEVNQILKVKMASHSNLVGQ